MQQKHTLISPIEFDNGKGKKTVTELPYDFAPLEGVDVMRARKEAKAYAGEDDEVAITAALFARAAGVPIDLVMKLKLVDFLAVGKIANDFLTASPSTSASSESQPAA